jgi:hypothetical protein
MSGTQTGSTGGHSSEQGTHVTLIFDRPVSEDEVKQMQMQHKAVRATAARGGGHHDHDHPTLV